VFSLRAFWLRMVVVTDPAMVHQLLRGERGAGVSACLGPCGSRCRELWLDAQGHNARCHCGRGVHGAARQAMPSWQQCIVREVSCSAVQVDKSMATYKEANPLSS
jgi:hypothetical protein